MPEAQGCRSVIGLVAFSTFVIWFAAALAVHLTIAILAPGDAGTAAALVSPIFVFVVLLVAPVVLVLFPLAAFMSWPFHKLAFDRPWLAYGLGATIGGLVGYLASFVFGSRGWVDQGPGLAAGIVTGLLWVLLVRRLGRRIIAFGPSQPDA